MTNTNNATDFYVLQLAKSVESLNTQKWIIEISRVIHSMGGLSLVPAKIDRSEPSLRRNGAHVIDEPLDDDRRSGALKRLQAVSSEQNIQAIIVHDYATLDIALGIKQVIDVPILFVLQEIFNDLSFFSKRRTKKHLNEVSHFIAVSEFASDTLMQNFEISRDRISLIYEGFDLHSLNSQNVSQERTMSLAHAWGAVENVSELVLIPANYADMNWCENLKKFANEIAANSSTDTRYIVVGDDDGSGAMRRIETALARNTTSRIQLAGHCADIEAAIKLTSTLLCLYAPNQCQFPEALIAQALGRFVFLPKVSPASREFIQENITGKCLENEPEVIREAIEGFIANEHNLREGNFVSSRSFIMANFSRDLMHKKLRTLFEDARFSKPDLTL